MFSLKTVALLLAAASSAFAGWSSDIVGTYDANPITVYPKGVSFLNGIGSLTLRENGSYEITERFFCKPGAICPQFLLENRESGSYSVLRAQRLPYPNSVNSTANGQLLLIPARRPTSAYLLNVGLNNRDKTQVSIVKSSILGVASLKQSFTAACSQLTKTSCQGGSCGGFTLEPFTCRDGLACKLPPTDIPGVCIVPFAFGYYVQGQFSRSGLAESAFAGVKNIVINADGSYELGIGYICSPGVFCIQISESQVGTYEIADAAADGFSGRLLLNRTDSEVSTLNVTTVTALDFVFADDAKSVEIFLQEAGSVDVVPSVPGFAAVCGSISGTDC